MANESIFSYLLDEKEVFNDVYKKSLEFEKLIVNKMYDSVFNTSRVIIEKLIKIIIVDVEEDRQLSKKYYGKKSKHTSLSEILKKCRDKKYISNYNKITSFIHNYANKGSHDNSKTFDTEDMEHAHKVIFELTSDCALKYNKRIRVPEYTFDLTYIDEKTFTKEEKDDIVNDTKIYEVSADDIVKKVENTFLSKEEFEKIVKPLISNVEEFSKELKGIDYITNDNLEEILTNFDASIKSNILDEVEKSNIENTKKIKEELDEIKQKQEEKYLSEEELDILKRNLNQDELYLSKEEFIDIVMPIASKVQEMNDNSFLNEMDFITNENLSYVLTHYDESIREDIFREVTRYNNEIQKELKEIRDNQITLEEINELIKENNKTILSSIKAIAGEIVKDQLTTIINEIQSVPTIQNGVYIDNPKYEIIDSNDAFEIKEIEAIIGIPDKCPECNTTLKKGATYCHSCGYDLFELINKRCPKCAQRIPIESKICPKCGYSLESIKCVKCGFENKIDSKFCVNCGNNLGD